MPWRPAVSLRDCFNMAWKMDAMIRRCPCLRAKAEDVRTLDFRHCSLADVPNEIFNFERTLEELYLDSNQIHDLPRPLFHCHELRTLGLSDNEIHSLPPAIASLINLEELDICKNGILDIPDNIKGCKCLRILEASVNPLGKLPDGFTQLINLEELYLNDTFVDYLPANFGRLSRLRILEVRENHLKTLPKSMARLTELTRFDIGQNDFRELPEVVGNLPKISEVWCDYNRISAIPPFIGNLVRLSYLDASQNRIESLPAEIQNCTNLADITLSSNNLETLPETIGQLRNLTILRLDDNKLKKLPNSIGKLANLEEFVLSQNDLRRLPGSIGLLRKMHTFIIDDNLLEELPYEIGSCASMTILSARGNRLTIIPDELGHIPRLRIINLSNNKIRYLPFSIAKLRDLQALWLSENQNKPLIPLQADIDVDTGKRVLTCYILPQLTGEQNDYSDKSSESFHSSNWENERPRRQHIKFAFDEKLDKPGKLVRNPTPYPKELKSHAKHARNEALKNKSANYVNISSVTPSDANTENKSSEEPLTPAMVVPEAKVWHPSACVTVKEARVTKPKSPNVSPKLHDQPPSCKYDKGKLVKDKHRLPYQNSSEAAFVTSSTHNSPVIFRKNQEGINTIKTASQVNIGKYSSLPDLPGGSSPRLPINPLSPIDNASIKEAKSKRTVSSSFLRKLEGLKQGRNNYQGFKNTENGYRSDHELYANVGHGMHSKGNLERFSPRMLRANTSAASEGYASDWEAATARRTGKMPPSPQFSHPCSQTGRSATVSAAVARRLSNGGNPSRPPLFGSYSRLFGNDQNIHELSSSSDSKSSSLANNGTFKENDSSVRNFWNSPSHMPPNAFLKNSRMSTCQVQEQRNSVPRNPTPGSPRAISHIPLRSGPPSPTPMLPPRQRNGQPMMTMEAFTPILPPRLRPTLQHPVHANIFNGVPQPKHATISSVMPPSPNRTRKPPPYHIAATYSKQVPDCMMGSSSHESSYSNQAPPFPYPSNSGMGPYEPSVHMPRSSSSPSGLREIISNPGVSPSRSPRYVPAYPPPSPPLEGFQTQKTRHGSDPSIRHSTTPPPTSSHFQQRSYGSVNGAVVYGNPYINEAESGDPATPDGSPNGRNVGHFSQPSSGYPGSRRGSRESAPSPVPGSNLHRPAQICSNLPNLKPLSFSSPTSPHHSLSAPSTPPLGDTSPVQLPPYRTPPLYQSASMGNLDSATQRANFGFAAHNRHPASRTYGQDYEQEVPRHGQEARAPNREPSHDISRAQHCQGMYGTNETNSGFAPADDSQPTSDSQWRSARLSGAAAHSGQYGIFTARPAMVNSCGGSTEAMVEVPPSPKESSPCKLPMLPNSPESCSTVFSNPYVNGTPHPPNLTQDKPSHDEGGMPLVIPTPHRPSSLGHLLYPRAPSGDNGDYESYDTSAGYHSAPQMVKKVATPWLFGQHHNAQVIPVVIQKNPDLGFTIMHAQKSPIKPNESTICIASVTPEGAASSVLRPGDKLLQVDGKDFTRLELGYARRLLEDTGSMVFMMVSRD